MLARPRDGRRGRTAQLISGSVGMGFGTPGSSLLATLGLALAAMAGAVVWTLRPAPAET